MSDIHEKDAMICRFCGNEERASEGYPCSGCGTFLCQICSMRGVEYCKKCEDEGVAAARRSEGAAEGGGSAGAKGA